MNNVIHYTCTVLITMIALPCIGMDRSNRFERKERMLHEAMLKREHRKTKNLRTSNKENTVGLGRSLRGSGKKYARRELNDHVKEHIVGN